MIKHVAAGVVYYQFKGLEGRKVPHALFTRRGGVSAPPFDTLNLGHTVGDDLTAVEENHRRACAVLGIAGEHIVSPHQVHGTAVRMVDQTHTGTVVPATDGLLTTTPGVALLLRFADCVPLLLYDPIQRAVGVIHSGWRSTAGNIAQAAVTAFAQHVGSKPAELWAGIGPCIGPCCYAVDAETAQAVAQACPASAEIVQEHDGALYLDLPRAVQAQLEAAGVHRIEQADICTACHTEDWFSHRAENGQTGRFGALAMLPPEGHQLA